jgi:hypothetical protein
LRIFWPAILDKFLFLFFCEFFHLAHRHQLLLDSPIDQDQDQNHQLLVQFKHLDLDLDQHTVWDISEIEPSFGLAIFRILFIEVS